MEPNRLEKKKFNHSDLGPNMLNHSASSGPRFVPLGPARQLEVQGRTSETMVHRCLP